MSSEIFEDEKRGARCGGWIDPSVIVAMGASDPLLEGESGHLYFQEDTRMNIGEPVRELEVEPLLAPAIMPEAPAEPSMVPQPDLEPLEVPD